MTVPQLELDSCIGFAGKVPQGLFLHPDDKHIIYALGSTIVVKHLIENKQRFLQKGGHDKAISCLTLDNQGEMLATGQTTHMGFPAGVIVWNFHDGTVRNRLKLHKGKVQCIAFSPSSKYVATLGGEDDNKVVVWNLDTGDAICGATAANDSANVITYLNGSDDKFVTGGRYNLRVWDFDIDNRKIRPVDVSLGQLKRIFTCIAVEADDSCIYTGTLSGDVLKVAVNGAPLYQKSGPKKKSFSQGVLCMVLTLEGQLLIGAGDGTIALLNTTTLGIIRSVKMQGGKITSLSLNAAGDHFFVGTSMSCSYLVALNDFEHEIKTSSHFGKINDIAFPTQYSELFVTASINDIRVWDTKNQNELLRIEVPNLECMCITLKGDGRAIVSGWSDGKVRAFLPESGRLMYTINDAHSGGGVTAIKYSNSGTKLVTGGNDGRVRVWTIKPDCQKMIGSLAEHKGRITSIAINADDTMFVTAGHDGSCVLWDMKKMVRMNALFGSTQFQSVVLHHDESQMITTGTDRKITYWDAVDCTQIRILDGSDSAVVNTLALCPKGEYVVSGGSDKLVRLWHYDEGVQRCVGIGHSGAVTRAKFSSDRKTIISVGDEGAIMIWKFPENLNEEAGEEIPVNE